MASSRRVATVFSSPKISIFLKNNKNSLLSDFKRYFSLRTTTTTTTDSPFSDESSPVENSFIDSFEIIGRQQRLLRAAHEHLQRLNLGRDPGAATPLILVASSGVQYQGDTTIPVADGATNSDFTYLTGLHSGVSDFLAADCVLALRNDDPQNPESGFRSTLFAPARARTETLWNGPDLMNSDWRSWTDSIAQSDVRPLSSLVEFVQDSLKNRRDVFVSKNAFQHRPELVTHLRFSLGQTSWAPPPTLSNKTTMKANSQTALQATVRDLSPLIDGLRVVKSPQESKALLRASRIGRTALESTIDWTRRASEYSSPSILQLNEGQVIARFNFEAKMLGARRLSFPPVCAAGPASTTIHYGRTDRPIYRDDWVLTDVGVVEPDGYCSDLTRCWPIDESMLKYSVSKSSALTHELYCALTQVQKELISSIVVGVTTLDDLHKAMLYHLSRLFASFNVFDRPISGHNELLSLTRRICPHHVSHYIGLDIHDTPTISRSRPITPGTCFSLEPGLYFPLNSSANLPIRQEYRGIGLRLEDDMLICPLTGAIINMTDTVSANED